MIISSSACHAPSYIAYNITFESEGSEPADHAVLRYYPKFNKLAVNRKSRNLSVEQLMQTAFNLSIQKQQLFKLGGYQKNEVAILFPAPYVLVENIALTAFLLKLSAPFTFIVPYSKFNQNENHHNY